jgi:hypothetical protein
MLYETRIPGVGFPGYKIFFAVASFLGQPVSSIPKLPMAQSLASH